MAVPVPGFQHGVVNIPGPYLMENMPKYINKFAL